MNAPEWHWFECFLSRLRKFCSVEIGDFDHVWVWLKMLWAGAWMNNSGACKDLILRVSALCLRSQHTHCFMIQRHVWTFHHLHAYETIHLTIIVFLYPFQCANLLPGPSLRLPWIPWGSPPLPQVLVHIAQSLLGIDLVQRPGEAKI